MENKIQELTDKIYREGVEKGNEEAQKLITKAQEEAKKIVENAQKEADSILATAHKSADELAENTKSELKLFAGQAVNALKSEIATLVTNKIVSADVKAFAANKDFLNAFIVALASKWSVNEPIVISTPDAEGLKKYFAVQAKDLLDKGVRIEQVNGIKTLFSVSPADGSYKVNFGEEEFMNYFKEFLRPQLVEMLVLIPFRIMSKYYYLVAGLPELTLEDSKLSYTVADFKSELYSALSEEDRMLIDLFYLQFDNANVLKLLKDKDAAIDPRGNYSAEELAEYISLLKEGGEVSERMFPSYLSTFISEYFNISVEDDFLHEDRLAALYYAYAMKCKNKFVSAWFSFNLVINNVLVALTARKFKVDVAPLIVGDTEVCEALRTSGARDFGLSGEVEWLDILVKISETEELVEREKKIDLLRWNWMEEATFFNYFTVERLFVFLLQLEMIERWISLDKEKGSQLFRSIIATLKDEVQIPAEFR